MSSRAKALAIIFIVFGTVFGIVVVPAALFWGEENIDPGVSACNLIDAESMTEDQYIVTRMQFESSSHEDLRTSGENYLDTVYLISGRRNAEALSSLQPKWADLQKACKRQGVVLPPFPTVAA
jgi:hypothetical protein